MDTKRQKKHPFIEMLDKLPDSYPYLQKFVGIYYDETKGGLEARSIELPSSKNKSINIQAVLKEIKQFRRDQTPHTWYHINSLPFEEKDASEKNLSLFSEENAMILLIRLKNRHDGQSDLLFLHFTPKGMGMNTKQEGLNTQMKASLSPIIYHQIKSLYKTILEHYSQLDGFRETARMIIENLQEGQKQEHTYEERQKAFIGELLDEISPERKYHLSKAALLKLMKSTISLSEMRAVLQQAIVSVEMLDAAENQQLPDWSIIIPEKASTETAQTDHQEAKIESRYLKSWQLLEKLEDAAQKVKSGQDRLTSANVGKALDSPITAPAISDALKKHGTRIISLLDRYPEKWLVIRKEFRPVQNLIVGIH